MTTFLRAESPINSTITPSKPIPRPEIFGQKLKQARQRLNLSIEEIAERIKLDPRQVSALEEERFDDLPGMAFVRGFTRQYARLLNLDETSLINLLPSPSTHLHNTASHLGVVPQKPKGYGTRRRIRIIKISLALIIGTLLIAVGLLVIRQPWSILPSLRKYSLFHTSPSQSISAPLMSTVSATTTTPVTLPTTAIEAPPSVIAPPLQTASPIPAFPVTKSKGHLTVKATANASPRIELAFEERSWVEIKDAQEHTLLSQINQPGSTQNVKGTPPFDVTIGNPRAVTIRYKGTLLDVQPYTEHDIAHFTLD